MFGEERSNPRFSLQVYHITGSRILSRSFQVQALSTTDSVGSSQTKAQEDAEMNLDEPSPHALNDSDSDEAEDGDDEDDPANVAMVPLADMMNARYGCENVRVHLPSGDSVVIVRPFRPSFSTRNTIFEWPRPDLFIRANKSYALLHPWYPRAYAKTQWNTYGDPPNSDLLRRYGHVDQVPLANGGLGNPADIVEIRADHVMEIVQHKLPQPTGPWSSERINWWLEEGGDECIPFSTC